MTGTLTFNENTTAGKILLQVINATPEFKFKVTGEGKQNPDKGRVIGRMRKAAANARELAASNPKTYSAKELMEML